jgi:capsular exopolysaccharide synthesis family protein
MSKQKTQIATLSLPTTDSLASSGQNNLLKKYLFHWPLFVLTVFLTIAVAYLYLRVTPSVYPISATIEFKTPTASSTQINVTQQNSTMETLNPIDNPIIVENEIEVMQSKKLIYDIVEQLQLWVTYTLKQGFLKSKDLYKYTPVKFGFIKQSGAIDASGIKLKVLIKNENEFVLIDSKEGNRTLKFSTPVKSNFGTWQLQPTANFNTYIDSTLVIAVSDPDQATEGYQKSIKVALQDKDAPFVDLSTSDQVPERGKDILNKLLELYLKFAVNEKLGLAEKSIKFIDLKVDSIRGQLEVLDKQIEQYKTNHHIALNVDTDATNYLQIKKTNTDLLNQVDLQLGILLSLEKYAYAPENSEKLPPVSGTLSEPGLTAIYDHLSELKLARQQMVETTPETSLKVVSLDRQISTLKTDFRDKLQTTKISLQAQRHQLESILSGVQKSLDLAPIEDMELKNLVRYQQSKENIYNFLLKKKEQVGLFYAPTNTDSEVVDDAHAGAKKWPIGSIVYALALILGLGVAYGILYLRDSLNELITDRKQLEEETEVPVLGELGYQDTDKQIVVTESRNKFAIGEQFRVLRTNLYHLHGNSESGRVTLFTSSVSGEGKSFVASNLAVTIAYTSRKTVILEMDLRKPKISVNFGLSADHTGISDYLAGTVSDISELIQPSGITGLDVISSGYIMPNPSELLEEKRLDEMIATLRSMYDDVIIDSPPIHLVTDALIIARVADVTLYVVRYGYTMKYEQDFISEINKTDRFAKFTMIFNAVKADEKSYGGYGYGYGYGGYGNSYNAYATKEKKGFVTLLREFLRRF